MKLLLSMVAIVAAFVGAGLVGELVVAPAVAGISGQVHRAMTAPFDNRGLA